jgi:predicted glycosyltransferase
MKILIDIGHPAHVHYFRNFIKIMEDKKHQVLVIARDKEVSQILLKKYNIPYITRGKGADSLMGKILYLIKTNIFLLIKSFSFKPDIFLSFSSPYASQVAWILRKPHIAFTDTEHATLENKASLPFSSVVLTPACFNKELGDKHIKFNSFMELFYLHKNYFSPNKVLDILNLEENDKYIVLRFVSWGASHDIGHSGLSDNTKIELVNTLSKNYKVFISSEAKLPKEFEKYKISISPEKMHDVLTHATLFIGEGATMASECAMLGTPAIYVNSLNTGYLIEEESNGSIFGYRDSNGVLEKAMELLKQKDLKELFQAKKEKLLSEKIDVTAFIVWFVGNYPKSFETVKNNPTYPSRFK